METLEPILAAHPFFQRLAPEHLKLLVGCATNVRFDAGAFLFRTGEDANQFFLIREGAVALEAAAPGRVPVVVQTLGAGEILGWSWLIPPYHWTFDARALEPTRAIALDGRCLREKCEADHDLGYELLKRISHILWERLEAERVQLLDAYAPPKAAR
jgi:CRP-like cAMP-binding protein